MHVVSYCLTTLFLPFTAIAVFLPKWLGITILALVSAIGALLMYRRVSDPFSIRKAKDKIKAGILEMLLFKDQPMMILNAQLRVLKANVRYFIVNLKPALFLFPPILLLIVQIELHLAHRHFNKEETFLFSAVSRQPLELKLRGLKRETNMLTIPSENRSYWRLRVTEPKLADIAIPSQNFNIAVACQDRKFLWSGTGKGAAAIVEPSPWGQLGSLEGFSLSYPKSNVDFLGWHVYWLYPYFALTLVFGFALKGVFNVEI